MSDLKKINILIVDDNPGDVDLLKEMLETFPNIGEINQAAKLSDAIKVAQKKSPDVVVLDLGLPDSQGGNTFFGFHMEFPTIPVILLTGLVDENIDTELVKEGAQDYLIKGKINADIIKRSILYSIERKKLEQDQIQLIDKLQDALDEIKRLKDLLSICAKCKKIRDDDDQWVPVEVYLQKHEGITFSHGLCPECFEADMRLLKKYKSNQRG